MIRLGIIGLSEGNGHPFSWSAIFNGYDETQKQLSGEYPVINAYLGKQSFPKDCIPNATVTHVWTQDKALSMKVAQFAKIKNIVDEYTDMIGHVDAILLARDDAQHHFEMAKVFIEQGLPIYIDKPLAYSVAEAERIFSMEQYPGQIFSCSAFKYAKEFMPSEVSHLGKIRMVNAKIIKNWKNYAIHLIDPILQFVSGEVIESVSNGDDVVSSLSLIFDSGVHLNLTTSKTNDFPIEIEVFGDQGYKRLTFQDTFFAFKASLYDFIRIISKEKINNCKAEVLRAIAIVERGLQ